MTDQDGADLKAKLEQARRVIEHLMGKAAYNGAEAQRALDYFAGKRFDAGFLPWPRHEDEGLRPDQLNAANDD